MNARSMYALVTTVAQLSDQTLYSTVYYAEPMENRDANVDEENDVFRFVFRFVLIFVR